MSFDDVSNGGEGEAAFGVESLEDASVGTLSYDDVWLSNGGEGEAALGVESLVEGSVGS